MLGLRKYYWFSKWNIFDFAITILSILDTTVVDIAVPTVKGVNPGLFRILSVFRILRIIRAGRLLKVFQQLELRQISSCYLGYGFHRRVVMQTVWCSPLNGLYKHCPLPSSIYSIIDLVQHH